MNAQAIKSLITGLLALAVLSMVVFFYQDIQSNIKSSQQSNISANSYVLGLDYSGIITQEVVNKGDFVHKGDALAYVKSGALLADLKGNKITKQDLIYPLSDDNQIVIQATQDGIVDNVNYLAGSYVPANQTIFKITSKQAPYVISLFNLSRADFQRLNKSTELQVKLPNGRLVKSPIQQITVNDAADNNSPTVAVKVQSTIDPDSNLLIGSPVTATLHLGQQTKLQQFLKYIKGL